MDNPQNGNLNHVFNLYKVFKQRKVILAFEGGFTQQVTTNILALAENKLIQNKEKEFIKKKVFNVMVECLQNICKNADEIERSEDWLQDGIFMIGKDEEGYFLVSGNLINNKHIPFLEDKIIEVNSLDKSGLKELFMNKLKTNTLAENGGAGLGLIDIARKSGHKLSYNFDNIDDKISFYTLRTKILRRHDGEEIFS